jgi:hypothetical protein
MTAIVIVSGWHHGHYPFLFVALIGVGLAAAWVRGFTDALQ